MIRPTLLALALCLGTAPALAVPPPPGTIEAAFSPEGGAEALVLRTFAEAQDTIHLAAYVITSPRIVAALRDARRRGVVVQVLVDEKVNLAGDRHGRSRAALNTLANAGVAVRTLDTFAAHHDKYAVVDGKHVQTGSFNYTAAAANRNSENVLVVWNRPALAQDYLRHWQSRWREGRVYRVPYE